MKIKTRRWDVVNYLQTDEEMAGYLEAVLEDPDPVFVRIALGNIARAKGIREIARQTGIDLKELNRAFLTDDEPNTKTVSKLIHALAPKSPGVPRKTKTDKAIVNVSRNTKRTKSKAS